MQPPHQPSQLSATPTASQPLSGAATAAPTQTQPPPPPYSKAPDIGCLVSTPKDSSGNRRKPRSIGEVSVYVPSLRIPKLVDFAQSLGDHLSKKIVECLSALRTRIVVMAGQEGPTITRTKRKSATQHGGSILLDLLQALEDYLPVLLGLVNDGSHLQYKVQFVWVNQEDDAEETTMSNGWYEVL
ncbi:uncharacterized protein [Arachis hypogaea]|uniref:uncharacterized protein n=1 Tax=Arachis hypogaea TaxID=3818 RepID=UPI003B215602